MNKTNKTEMILNSLTDMESFAQGLPVDNIFYENCKVCISPLKSQIEDMCDRGISHLQISKWVKSETKEDISYGSIHNHLINHYGVKNDNRKIKDYAKQISQWSNLSRQDEAIMNRYITMLDREASLLLSEGKEVSMSERRKNIETAVKVAQVIGSFRDKLREIKSLQKPVELVITSLNRIIQIKLDSDSSPEIRHVLLDIVEQLKKEVGDISIEGEQNG